MTEPAVRLNVSLKRTSEGQTVLQEPATFLLTRTFALTAATLQTTVQASCVQVPL